MNLSGEYRKAFYIRKTEIEATYNKKFTAGAKQFCFADVMSFDQFRQCIDMNTTYSTSGNAEYRLVSWHTVDENGNMSLVPFNFSNRIEQDTRLKARWMRLGKYSLVYNPTMKSTGITGSMARYTDPLESGRKYADASPLVILQQPTDLRLSDGTAVNDYVFRGWRIVDGTTGEPLEENKFYDPGDTYVLDAGMADAQGVIHLEAYYEKDDSTIRRVDVTSLSLDANDDKAAVNSLGLTNDRYEYADLNKKQVKLERRSNNFDVHLENYTKNFTHTDGKLLVGWNKTPDAGDYIPDFYADAVIGVNKDNTPPNNTLYAVWEPMVYLTLQNKTAYPVTFELKFNNNRSASGVQINEITENNERKKFVGDNESTQKSADNYGVTLSVGETRKLVLPKGEGITYSVTGSYVDKSGHKTLIVYNSVDTQSTTINYSKYNWYKNGVLQYSTPVAYSTEGTLIKGPVGQLVLFTDENPETELELMSRYYDLASGSWKDGTKNTGAKADAHFVLPGGCSEQLSDDGVKTSVKLIRDNENVKFGLEVKGYDTGNYKFIGWYNTADAAPNAYTVDGKINEFGAATIKDLPVPTDKTTYYALFVPYVSGDLNVSHSEREDSAGHCKDSDGLSLEVKYGAQTETAFGDKDTAAVYTIPSSYISEKNTGGSVKITVGAVPHEGSIFKATYLGGEKMVSDENNTSVYTVTVPELFCDSDAVKGLKVLRGLSFFSTFSRGYKITYHFTARDGSPRDYVLTGNAESFTDFKQYVIEHTPYERTLAGDTVWDIDNMKLITDEYGMSAELSETPKTRSKCTVRIIEAGGYTPTERVVYGETFTAEQAARHIAPLKNESGQQFDYWDIVNTDTNEHIANCYSPKFTFAVWNNYTITPLYSDTPSTKADEGTLITIDYIDTSRNQWGTAIYGDDDELDRSKITDKVVADVDISFIDGSRKILANADKYKLGVIFEICGNTDDGSFDADDFKSTESAENTKKRVDDILKKAKASNTGSDYYDGTATAYFYTRIGINTDTVSNFNRSEFARSFNSAVVKNKVLRMYAYMVTPEGETILSAPKYFSMYNFASPEHAIQ